MKIVIDEHKEVSTIRDEFNAVFPYLKIELFSKPVSQGDGLSKKIIKHNRTLEALRILRKKGKLIITPDMTVLDLDKQFRNIYGIFIKVFRKSGKAWLEATLTEGWTLEEQNRQGKDLST